MVCLACQFTLAFMYFFSNFYTGFYNMMLAMMLGCGIAQMNYCCISFYMLYITMDWIYNVCTIGLVI